MKKHHIFGLIALAAVIIAFYSCGLPASCNPEVEHCDPIKSKIIRTWVDMPLLAIDTNAVMVSGEALGTDSLRIKCPLLLAEKASTALAHEGHVQLLVEPYISNGVCLYYKAVDYRIVEDGVKVVAPPTKPGVIPNPASIFKDKPASTEPTASVKTEQPKVKAPKPVSMTAITDPAFLLDTSKTKMVQVMNTQNQSEIFIYFTKEARIDNTIHAYDTVKTTSLKRGKMGN